MVSRWKTRVHRRRFKSTVSLFGFMVQILRKETVASAFLTIGVFYFSFMILNRVLSIIYGFNFQPFGPDLPLGFTFWGHLLNGSAAASGLFVSFKIYDYGKERNIVLLQVLALCVYFATGAVIPYVTDAVHLMKHGAGDTLAMYVAANDLYVFFWGFLMFRVTKTVKKKATVLGVLFAAFVTVHFVLYAPMFPEFYWS